MRRCCLEYGAVAFRSDSPSVDGTTLKAPVLERGSRGDGAGVLFKRELALIAGVVLGSLLFHPALGLWWRRGGATRAVGQPPVLQVVVRRRDAMGGR